MTEYTCVILYTCVCASTNYSLCMPDCRGQYWQGPTQQWTAVHGGVTIKMKDHLVIISYDEKHFHIILTLILLSSTLPLPEYVHVQHLAHKRKILAFLK